MRVSKLFSSERWNSVKYLTLAFCVLLAPLSAQAQTIPVITSGVHVTFTASVDHTVVVEGAAVLTGYQLDSLTMTRPVQTGPLVAGAIALTLQLGKPTPGPGNTIDVAVPSLYSGLVNGVYTATVAAFGPGGVGLKSAVSDPFLKLGPAAAPGKPSIVVQ